LSHQFIKNYEAFTGKSWHHTKGSENDPKPILGFISSLADSNHSILLRTLLDREFQKQNASPLSDNHSLANLSASGSAYVLAQEKMEWVRAEASAKFFEFRDKWRKRLAFTQLNPFLQRNQWYQMTIGGFALMGKGTRKDSKMLFLQTLHDMASDGERQVSAISGQLFRMQAEVSAVWHRESVTDDRSRLLPVLEEAMRAGEAELFKKVRLSLGDLAVETFQDRVCKWEKRIYGTELELFQNIAGPWFNASQAKTLYRSGFEGFMESFADLSEAVSTAMIEHYIGKWDLFLRGLAPQQAIANITLLGEK